MRSWKDVDELLKVRFIEEHDGAISLGSNSPEASGKVGLSASSKATCRKIAEHLRARATELGEPMGILRAGELGAHAGDAERALDTFSTGWEAVRDFGFSQAYLKSLASIPLGKRRSRPSSSPLGSRADATRQSECGSWRD